MILPKQIIPDIVFKNTLSDRLTVLVKKGNGKGRLIAVCENKQPEEPIDGNIYKANPNFGTSESKIGKNTYVVYSGNGFETPVTGLKPNSIYYFQVFEYNGESDKINYFCEKANQNPRKKLMPISPPEALQASDITSNGFTAHWKPVDMALSYEIDVSSDKKFIEVNPQYSKLDVGNVTEIEVIDLKPGKYYFRITAVIKDNTSSYSNVIEVSLK